MCVMKKENVRICGSSVQLAEVETAFNYFLHTVYILAKLGKIFCGNTVPEANVPGWATWETCFLPDPKTFFFFSPAALGFLQLFSLALTYDQGRLLQKIQRRDM